MSLIRSSIAATEDVPEYDFDGNPLPASPLHNVLPVSEYPESSAVRIHRDEGDDEEGIIDDDHHHHHDIIPLSSRSTSSLHDELYKCHAYISSIQNELALRQHNEGIAPNTTHLPHRAMMAGQNQFWTPIVPVEEVLAGHRKHEEGEGGVEMTKVDEKQTNGHSAATANGTFNGTKDEHAIHINGSDKNSNGASTAAVAGAAITPKSKSHKDIILPTSTAAPTPTAPPPALFSLLWFQHYFLKFQGQHVATLPISHWHDILLAFIASFIGIAVPALINYNLLHRVEKEQYLFLIASMGASAVLLYSAPMSDFSQPRNVIGGHGLSAVCGVIARHLVFPDPDQIVSPLNEEWLDRQWLACAIAVSLAIVVMNVTKTIHPPGGATALQACLVNTTVRNLDWAYIGFMTTTATIMTLIAVVTNNIPRKKIYPKFWW